LIDCHEYLYHQLGLCSDEIALYFEFVFNDFDCITEVASFFVRVTNNSQYDALLRNFDLSWYFNNDILRPTNNRRPHRYMRGNLFSVREFDTEHVYIGSSLDHFADMPVRNTGDVVNYRAALDDRDFPCDFNSVADRYAHRDDFPYGVALQIPREDVRIIAEIEVIVNTDLEEGCINFVWTDNQGESYVNRNFIRCRRSDDAPDDYTYNFIDYLSPEDPAGACLFDKCNIPEVCDDGIDNDLDGLIDCEDDDCGASDAIEVSISLDQHASCVDSEGGQITIHSNAYDLSAYNICVDDQCTDDEGIINQLPAGDHDLIITNSEDCPVPYTVATEICGNDIDDDGDGYVDCFDLDCILNDKNLNKSDESCPVYDSELVEVISDIIDAEDPFAVCGEEMNASQVLNDVLNLCGEDCTPEMYFQILRDQGYDFIVDIDPGFVFCSRLYCVWSQIKDKAYSNLQNEDSALCGLLGNIIANPRIAVFFELEDVDDTDLIQENTLNENTLGLTGSHIPFNGVTTVWFNDNLCKERQPFLAASAIIHELIHVEIFNELYGLSDIETTNAEVWFDWINRNHPGLDLTTQHQLMARFHVDRISTILWELNEKIGRAQDYEWLAWGGLRRAYSPPVGIAPDVSENQILLDRFNENVASHPSKISLCN